MLYSAFPETSVYCVFDGSAVVGICLPSWRTLRLCSIHAAGGVWKIEGEGEEMGEGRIERTVEYYSGTSDKGPSEIGTNFLQRTLV